MRRFLRIVRRVGTRTQHEIGRAGPTRRAQYRRAQRPSVAARISSALFRGRIAPGNRTDRAPTHSTMCLSFRPEQFAVTTCARKWAVLLTSWADHGFTMIDSPTVRVYSTPATSMLISPSSTV